LAESEATLRAVLDTRSDATFVLDPAGAVLSANRGAAALLERPAQKIPGEQLSDLLRPDSAELLRLHIEAVRRSARPVEWEDYGFGRTLRVTLRPISDVHGGAGRLILTCVDVTDHNAATDALRDSHRVLAAVIEASSVAIVAVDTEGRIVMWNQAAEQVFGWNDGQASGRPLPELLASDAAAKSSCVAAALSGQNVSRVEASCRRSDGRAIDLLVTAVPVRDALDSITGAVVAAADVTERNRLRAHLRGSQRAGAAIDLAGGVAHGLTNLLQTLTGYAEVLNARSTDHTRVLSVAQDLAQQVRRGAALTRDLTLLSRRTPAFRQVTELGQLLKDTVPTLRRVLPDSVGIRLEPCGNPLPAEVDPVQMTQVLISLAHNAVDAMPDGGVLVLASGSESECVWLELRDSGIGIAPEVLARACEPFFTTKDPFRHPGLGLALAKDTVAEHGGTLHLRSVPGEGTVARIDLPRGAGIPAVNAPVARGFEDLPAAAKGERVLIVEDEDGARQGLWDMLTVLGYRAIAVSSGEEAGALPTEWRFDALVTDVVLPGIAGPELAGGLRDRWPEIKVILMSACAEEDVRQRPSVGAAARFLQKPFGLDALARELRVVLDSPPPMSVAA
jgi:two-component system cell cycle sensor histidine kinase/response regulator CckA